MTGLAYYPKRKPPNDANMARPTTNGFSRKTCLTGFFSVTKRRSSARCSSSTLAASALRSCLSSVDMLLASLSRVVSYVFDFFISVPWPGGWQVVIPNLMRGINDSYAITSSIASSMLVCKISTRATVYRVAQYHGEPYDQRQGRMQSAKTKIFPNLHSMWGQTRTGSVPCDWVARIMLGEAGGDGSDYAE